jgi:hypothetical protein
VVDAADAQARGDAITFGRLLHVHRITGQSDQARIDPGQETPKFRRPVVERIERDEQHARRVGIVELRQQLPRGAEGGRARAAAVDQAEEHERRPPGHARKRKRRPLLVHEFNRTADARWRLAPVARLTRSLRDRQRSP